MNTVDEFGRPHVFVDADSEHLKSRGDRLDESFGQMAGARDDTLTAGKLFERTRDAQSWPEH